MASRIPTRFLVISDTHGEDLKRIPKEPVDVLIHCGDLTQESKLEEFRRTISLLQAIPAKLKLVIAGNHDFTLDKRTADIKLSRWREEEPAAVKSTYGDENEARKLFETQEVKAASIHYLDEGVHRFELANAASLTVYASPYTPSVNEWGFEYVPQQGHEWSISRDVDVCITHGPPRGIFDQIPDVGRVGDPALFAAVARARPLMHSFGHIHSQWGARRVAWREQISAEPSHFTDINNGKSEMIERLANIEARENDPADVVAEKEARLCAYREKGYCSADRAPRPGAETVFLNAAIEGKDDESQHLPWIIDLSLPRRGTSTIGLEE